MNKITASVGKGGKNKPEDVTEVQKSLNDHAQEAKYSKVKANGDCGADTLKAIIAVQKAIGMKSPDGRVDPGGQTFKALSQNKLPTPPKDDGGPKGAAKPGKLAGKGRGCGANADLMAFAEAVAAFYGKDIQISSGKRSAKEQGDAMWKNWTGNLKRGQLYSYLKSNPKTLQKLDDYYKKANEEKGATAQEKKEAESEFKSICEQNAAKLSLHVAGRAFDVSPKSCMTPAMRAAMKTGMRELEEKSCYHYDDQGQATPAVTDALKKKWKAP